MHKKLQGVEMKVTRWLTLVHSKSILTLRNRSSGCENILKSSLRLHARATSPMSYLTSTTSVFTSGVIHLFPIPLVSYTSQEKELSATYSCKEHARNWITKIKAQCDLGLKELIDALEDPTSAQESVALTHVPVCFLREIQEDGSELLLGHMGIFRCPHITLLDNPKYDSEINSSLPTGHTDIVWTIGGTAGCYQTTTRC
jgi:hypothetical protein